jgi:hypothetical protein
MTSGELSCCRGNERKKKERKYYTQQHTHTGLVVN